MRNNKKPNEQPNWDHLGTGDYESGLIFGREMSKKFLSFMGSGQVAVYNVALPALMASLNTFYRDIKDSNRRLYLDGQRDGFLGKLSEFLVVAAYMNNCAIGEQNHYDPALIKKPKGLA